MAKCGDCLYFGFCKKYIDPEETFPEIGGCHTFKSKDAFVEVVRCRNCKYFSRDAEYNRARCNFYTGCIETAVNGYCYHGAKMDGGNEDA